MPEAFGRYQLLRKLATGGMAQIYLARQTGEAGFEKLLVIKRILPHLAENDEFIHMFLDEARIAARLNHPNVVQIFDLGEEQGSFFIAMEYLHGEDARRVWKQADRVGKPLPVHLACRIVMDACAGLDFAHKKTNEKGEPYGIVHRDVSPQNIIVTFEGGVKVVDFGIAKAVDQSSVTRSGVVKGKYSYMSPEQAAGKRVDARTDQFALGVVLYELVTGERLFKRPSDIETLKAVEKCQVDPPSVVNPRVPPSLDPLIMRALSKSADDRYPDCLAFQLALEEWLVANRLPSSSAQLSAFLADIYAERLDEEKKLGHPLWEDMASGPYATPGSGEAPRSAPSKSGPTSPAKASSKGSPSGSYKSASKPSASALRPKDGPKATTLERALSVASPLPEAPPPVRKSEPARPVPAGLDDDIGGSTISEVTSGPTQSTQGSAVRPGRPGLNPTAIGLGAAGVAFAGIVGLVLLARPTPVPTPQVSDPPVTQVARPPQANTGPDETRLAAATTGASAAPQQVRVSFVCSPPGAQVQVNGDLLGDCPVEREYPLHAKLEVVGSLGGYPSVTRQVVLATVDPKVSLVFAKQTADPGPPPTPHHTGHVRQNPSNKPPEAERPTGIGRLLVLAPGDTYAEVKVDGLKRGTTPMESFELPEGRHVVLCENPETQKSQRVEVTIRAGADETVKCSMK